MLEAKREIGERRVYKQEKYNFKKEELIKKAKCRESQAG